MGFAPITDWRARLVLWMYHQFRNKPFFLALVGEVIGRQQQDLEDAIQAVLSARILDNAAGFALDLWGEVFNEKRNGRDDATYRVALLLAVLRDRSSGTPEEMIDILTTISGAARIYLDEYHNRSLRLFLENPTLTTALANEIRTLADKLAPAGVRVGEVSERPATYFGFAGDPDSGGFGTVEDPSVGGAWTKLV